MSGVVNQDRINALRNLLGESEINDKLLSLFRGGSGTAGRVNLEHFAPFRERLSLGESQQFSDEQLSLKNFIQEVNRQLEEPVIK